MATMLSEDGAPTRVTPSRGRSGAPEDAAPRGASGGVNQTLSNLLKAIDDVEIHNQHDFHEFCEGVRKLGVYLAVQLHVAAEQMDAGAREMARSEATLGIVSVGIRGRIRRITKSVESAGSHFSGAAADAIKAWHAMEGLLDELRPETKVKRPRGFTIDMG